MEPVEHAVPRGEGWCGLSYRGQARRLDITILRCMIYHYKTYNTKAMYVMVE